MNVLELGCGSIGLRDAERFPRSRFVAVSSSRSQRSYIEAEATRRSLDNLRVVTALRAHPQRLARQHGSLPRNPTPGA